MQTKISVESLLVAILKKLTEEEIFQYKGPFKELE
jgi:hypothetical protein